MTVYNLEYSILDKIGRAQKYRHKGVYASLEAVSRVQQEILRNEADDNTKQVKFNIYAIDNLFERIS